jgi:hypothetical protein
LAFTVLDEVYGAAAQQDVFCGAFLRVPSIANAGRAIQRVPAPPVPGNIDAGRFDNPISHFAALNLLKQ